MFGPMYSQLMKARLGVGKPMEGYGGFPPQGASANGMNPQATLPAPSPWMNQGGPRTTPYGQPQANMPAPSPWMHQGGPRTTPYGPRPQDGTTPLESPWGPRQTPFEPRPRGGTIPVETPWNPRSTPFEDRPQGGETRMGASGVMGGMKNPWQRY